MKDNVKKLYNKTHKITRIKFKRFGSDVELDKLKDNQSVCYGDGKNYFYLLTKKEGKQ